MERITFCTLTLALFLICGCADSAKEGLKEALERRGISACRKGDFDSAIADFTEAIRVDPTYADAYYMRGGAYQEKGDFDSAIADFTEAIRLNPKYTEAYIDRGNAYQKKGEHDKAISDLTEAIRLNPKDALAYYNRGIAYGKKDDLDNAIADYTEAIRLNPKDADAYHNRGNAYVKKGERDSAIADRTEAHRLDPKRYNRVVFYGQIVGTDKEIGDYSEAIPLDPKDVTAKLPKELTLDLGNNVTMKLVLIAPGKFLMGSPENENQRLSDERQHEVTISQPFYMGTYEVTRGQFAAFVKDSGYRTDAEREGWAFTWTRDDLGDLKYVKGADWRTPGFDQTDEHPVVCVSHNDAMAFCVWLSKRTGRDTLVKLPSEAQWEYACRAHTTTAYQWGDDPNMGKGWCNAADLTAKKQFPNWKVFNWEDGYVFTSPVGQFKPNSFGLQDMHGNVHEWCEDWYVGSYRNKSVTDPHERNADERRVRVYRGGSWYGYPVRVCRSACRQIAEPALRYSSLGFRVIAITAR